MLPYYPFWWTDYSGDTFSLSQGQHGAYFLLLRHVYTEGTGIPHAERYSIARAMSDQEQSNTDHVLAKYFFNADGLWVHERASEVIQKANAAHERRVNAGKMGGEAKASKSSNARAKPRQPLSNQNQNHIEDTNVSSPGGGFLPTEGPASPKTIMYGEFTFDQVFEYIWKEFPTIRDKGHKGKARDQFAIALTKGGKNETDWRNTARTIADGTRRYRKYCTATCEKNPDAFRWIRDEGFNRPWEVTGNGGRKGYSLEAVHDQAVADTTGRPGGREQRLAAVVAGFDPDAGQ